jgi:hypothetical protein
VRETWRERGGGDFEGWWRRCLHDGVIAEPQTCFEIGFGHS